MRTLSLLGSTGSIGLSALSVVEHHSDLIRITALAAGRNRERLLEQCQRFHPEFVSCALAEDVQWIQDRLDYRPELGVGRAGLQQAARLSTSNTVLVAVVGAVGLEATLAGLETGKRVCVANKESLVVGGPLIRSLLHQGRGELLPVDSEHGALHQLLVGRDPSTIREVRITASGGPFRSWPLERLQQATIDEALAHPTWKMGPKITVDSATLMNKGLEVIEASMLFGLQPEQISVTVHPQSQVHAMVGFTDGSYQLQVATNDMRLPIQYALFYPESRLGPVPVYDWQPDRLWTFEKPDLERFPCLALAYEALRLGGTAPAILNAANEVAVAAFLEGSIGFWDIQALNAEVLHGIPAEPIYSLDQVLQADARARQKATAILDRAGAELG